MEKLLDFLAQCAAEVSFDTKVTAIDGCVDRFADISADDERLI